MRKSGIYHVKFDKEKLDRKLRAVDINKSELAVLMDVSRRTLYYWFDTGTMPLDRYFQILDLFGSLDKEVIEQMGLSIGAQLV